MLFSVLSFWNSLAVEFVWFNKAAIACNVRLDQINYELVGFWYATICWGKWELNFFGITWEIPLYIISLSVYISYLELSDAKW